MDSEALWLIGAGGHGKSVAAAARPAGFQISGVFDDDVSAQARTLLGALVVSPVPLDQPAGLAHVAIGDNTARKNIVAARSAWHWALVRHPETWVDSSAIIGSGTLICVGARILVDAIIGAHTIINVGATVGHECRIGDYCHVAAGAILAGAVVVGEGAFVGIGSCVAPRVTIGAWAIVGAGAVVVRDVPPGATVVGNPARPLAQSPHSSA